MTSPSSTPRSRSRSTSLDAAGSTSSTGAALLRRTAHAVAGAMYLTLRNVLCRYPPSRHHPAWDRAWDWPADDDDGDYEDNNNNNGDFGGPRVWPDARAVARRELREREAERAARRLTAAELERRVPAQRCADVRAARRHARRRQSSADKDDDDDDTASTAPSSLASLECAICQDPIAADGAPDRDPDVDLVRVLPCGHLFHAACIGVWVLGFQATCPLCKYELAEDA